MTDIKGKNKDFIKFESCLVCNFVDICLYLIHKPDKMKLFGYEFQICKCIQNFQIKLQKVLQS